MYGLNALKEDFPVPGAPTITSPPILLPCDPVKSDSSRWLSHIRLVKDSRALFKWLVKLNSLVSKGTSQTSNGQPRNVKQGFLI